MESLADKAVATILAVDDETENAALVRRSLLLRPNLGVIVAFSGTEALAILQSRTVDVLIVDQRMPQMPGVELVKRTRWLPRPPPTIMLTAFPDEEAVVAAQARGLIQCVIAKPWKVEDLLRAVDSIVLKISQRQDRVEPTL